MSYPIYDVLQLGLVLIRFRPAEHSFLLHPQVEPFNNNPEFTPEQIEKASKACTAICMWALAMYQYHFVALGVAPKVRKNAEAKTSPD